MELCFVLAPGQNHFFVEMVDAMRDELDQIGVANSVAVGDYPNVSDDVVFVLCPPHEYFALTDPAAHPGKRELRRTIFICAEQPDTSFFERNVELAQIAGSKVFDINGYAVREFSKQGVKAQHFPLGWTRTWAMFDPNDEPAREITRPIDVLHLGTRSPRREELLGRAARYLAPHECILSLGDESAPLRDGDRDWVGEDAKWKLLGDTRVLLNIHRDERPYFEWLRMVQAMCNGATVVSDWSVDTAPLNAGVEFFHAIGSDLGPVVDVVLRDEPHRHDVACRAFNTLRDALPFGNAVRSLAEVAGDLAGSPGAARPPELSEAEMRDKLASGARVTPRKRFSAQFDLIEHVQSDETLRLETTLTQYLKDQKLQIRELSGQVERLKLRAERGREPGLVERVYATPALAGVRPKVSVITPLYNYEEHIAKALASVTRCGMRDIEHIIVDDGSEDGSLARAREWMKENPKAPALLLSHPANRGLGPARNSALGAARGRYVFALDADNSVFPRGLERLAKRLDEDPEAGFAYGYLERHDQEYRSFGMLSSYPWDPYRFGDGNYIDAMVMWRKRTLDGLGRYCVDPLLYGWEDYEIFLRLASAGGYGVLEPQFVARYRTHGFSMARTTNMSAVSMARKLTEMYPQLLHPDRVPA